MKKIIIMLITLFPMSLYAQRQEFVIEGSFVKKDMDGKVHYNYNERGINVADSTPVINGRFEFKGKVSGIQRAYFTFKPTRATDIKLAWRDSKSIYIEPGSFKIVAKDSISTARVVGSAINSAYESFMAPLEVIAKERKPLWDEYVKIKAADRKVLPRAAELKAKIDETTIKREELLKAYVRSHPKSYFSIEAITELMGPYVVVEKVDELWGTLDPELKESYNGKIINAVILGSKATDVGSRAPVFAQPDTSGKIVKLKDIKGKYVLVDFWASWCHPCRAENPNVLKAYNAYKTKNFTVVGISIDFEKDKGKWIKAIKDDGMPWTQLLSPANIDGGAMKAYGIHAIPSNFLVDPNGIIIAKNLHGPELQKKLEELFN
ncbi:TlpA disulfide reductase family protein [Mucilaginibacter sp. OK283]|jgi:peroxiredoxin|uniref:TlpA disulfide reductase family protein n=1 Tax=Mucilaginibacter sp. OK283 TaxID=1881049 RepID=UPI0008D8D475|nr:TlpA disulfide reductase family protein [Mucilaginibacter sp. OK283]SEO78000.1 Peroxiredoxin [Mucilaginibacter sp. OK283]